LESLNSGSTNPVTVSLNIGDFDDVVCINIEATNGTVYTPTVDCGETSTLNNGG
jgi:hypothetical protein